MWKFNKRLNRWQDPRGRIVSWATIRNARNSAIFQAERDMRDLTQMLRDGQIGVDAWQQEMAKRIKAIHVANGSIPVGGINGMNAEDRAAIEDEIRRELNALRQFAQDAASGAQPMDGTILRRVDHYARAGRKTFHIMMRRQMLAAGYFFEKTVRTAAERSCQGCIAEEMRVWVSIGALIPIGDRTCKRNCLCLLYFMDNKGKVSGPF